MKWVLWIVSGLLAFGCGVFLLAYLVVDPLRIGLVVLLGIVLVGLWVLTAVTTFKGWQVLWGSLLAIACLVGGYLAATSVYLAREEHRALAAITRSESDPGDGHTAVLYFTHGEPPAYSPMPWIETFHELDSDGVSFIPWPFRPVFLNNLRREYLVVGGSAHNKVHQIMLQSLVQSLPQAKEQGVRFYQAFLDNAPRPDEMAIQAINDGASKLVIVPVFLTNSSHTQAGQEMIDAVGAEKYGIDACYAKPAYSRFPILFFHVRRRIFRFR